MNEQVRAWIYRGFVVICAAMFVLGFVTEEQAITIIGMLGGVLGNGLASFNTSISSTN